jgi:hypothetical protein
VSQLARGGRLAGSSDEACLLRVRGALRETAVDHEVLGECRERAGSWDAGVGWNEPQCLLECVLRSDCVTAGPSVGTEPSAELAERDSINLGPGLRGDHAFDPPAGTPLDCLFDHDGRSPERSGRLGRGGGSGDQGRLTWIGGRRAGVSRRARRFAPDLEHAQVVLERGRARLDGCRDARGGEMSVACFDRSERGVPVPGLLRRFIDQELRQRSVQGLALVGKRKRLDCLGAEIVNGRQRPALAVRETRLDSVVDGLTRDVALGQRGRHQPLLFERAACRRKQAQEADRSRLELGQSRVDDLVQGIRQPEIVEPAMSCHELARNERIAARALADRGDEAD